MRCPVCRAENDGVTCRRCKADLSLLVTLEQTRARTLADAADAAKLGDGMRTLQHAADAHRLRADGDSLRWLAVGYLLQRDFAQAFTYLQRARQSAGFSPPAPL